MVILLSVLATLIVLLASGVAANIYDAPPIICYACRWAVLLWLGTLAAVLFGTAIWLS